MNEADLNVCTKFCTCACRCVFVDLGILDFSNKNGSMEEVKMEAYCFLVSQAFRKKGKGLVNCVCKPCPAALYSVVQSHCSILSHDVTVWVAIAVLKTVKVG